MQVTDLRVLSLFLGTIEVKVRLLFTKFFFKVIDLDSKLVKIGALLVTTL